MAEKQPITAVVENAKYKMSSSIAVGLASAWSFVIRHEQWDGNESSFLLTSHLTLIGQYEWFSNVMISVFRGDGGGYESALIVVKYTL